MDWAEGYLEGLEDGSELDEMEWLEGWQEGLQHGSEEREHLRGVVDHLTTKLEVNQRMFDVWVRNTFVPAFHQIMTGLELMTDERFQWLMLNVLPPPPQGNPPLPQGNPPPQENPPLQQGNPPPQGNQEAEPVQQVQGQQPPASPPPRYEDLYRE